MTHPSLLAKTGRRTVLRGVLATAGALTVGGARSWASEPPLIPEAVVPDPHHYSRPPSVPVTAPSLVCDLAQAMDWHDPAAWADGKVPGPSDKAIVDRAVCIHADAEVAGVEITPQGHLVFSSDRTVRLASTRNVVVHGTLTMRPTSAAQVHTLVFEGIDEAAFVGGGMEVLDSDIGLWVVDSGLLQLEGSDRTPWTRAATSIRAGATTVDLQGAPHGWHEGDELQITPTLAPDQRGFAVAYDYGLVAGVDGPTLSLDRPAQHEHPQVAGQWGAEVLNLTRNVRIEGTAGGRSHIIVLHDHQAQTIRNVAIRYMGPRQADGKYTSSVLGRYGLHFHHCYEGSSGSVVENVTITDTGAHAFVPHESHGIVFRGCISHNTFDDAYWWDPPETRRDATPQSDSIIYDACVASLVRCDPTFRGFRLTGFNLRHGRGNACVGSVAVGVQGNKEASGFLWPENGSSVWGFDGNVAHNNAANGIFVWQNSVHLHVVSNYDAYHNAAAGIDQGAYRSSFTYEDCTLWGNGTGVKLHATAKGDGLNFRRVLIDGGGVGKVGVTTARHRREGDVATTLDNCVFRNLPLAVSLEHTSSMNGPTEPAHLQFVDCEMELPREQWFRLHNRINPASAIRVMNGGEVITVRRKDRPGAYFAPWNASLS